LRRSFDRPHFTIDPAIQLVDLLDVRSAHAYRGCNRLTKRAKRILVKSRSRLVHEDDDMYAHHSLWIDGQLVRFFLKLRSCILVTTRPSLNLLAAKYAHESVITVGQEHEVFDKHAPKLQEDIRRAYARLDALVCVDPDTSGHYQRMLRSSSTTVCDIPNACAVAEALDDETRSKVVLAAGRLTEQKGYDLLISLFATVASEAPDWRLHIYGNGPLRAQHRQQILDCGLHNHVHLYPGVSNLSDRMSEAGVLALSSRWESFGMVLVEAMGQGLPCVAFEAQGPNRILRDGENGFLVPQGRCEEFAQRLLDLIRNPGLRKTVGAAGWRDALSYSLENIGERWQQFFWELCRRRAKPGVLPPAGHSAGARPRLGDSDRIPVR
jgi:glycosyltransferase involved in cell wall biosynthesis